MTSPAPEHNPFSSVVTARDVYDATRETQADVRNALTRLTALEREHAEFRHRLTALERWRYALPITGISAALAALGAVLTALIG
ncbi:hypothetical protein NE857_05660 [Nocardiopsis exhalans]|uniref:Uncharacterized protein n=2 Tax=Nocardiopsis TaxID=2013 RepID=A0A840WFL7_9ACTN|nr:MULTISPECIES: hypothetical protein [Nocardiopsis]MBB5495022.1 hypothetical protein [Nocardiopsis metallicus]USY21128.1 hypothetical protein NE857_05660 [Nocardiopsis exhalans]